MKVLQINIFGNLSTGRIAVDLYHTLRDNGHDGLLAFARNQTDPDVPHYVIGSKASVYLDGIMTRLTDRAGFYSRGATQKLIEKIKAYDPDIIHLHNLHGYYINIELLFNYLRECGKPVVWTLHDCWAFTGHCCYYSIAGCEKWKTGCEHCPQKSEYPKSAVMDRSAWNYRRKRELFTSLPNLHLVCVSKWLESQVEQSYLRKIPHQVIYNGIDLNIFQPTESGFRQKHGFEQKKIILGVASSWSVRKGLADFIQLASMIDERYRIVLVGLTEKQRKGLPSNILGLGRTANTRELVEIYTAADVFFNASVEETFGLPTVEAMACGTPVVVYDATALPEVCTPISGMVVPPNDLGAVIEGIKGMEENPLDKANIIAQAKSFDRKKQFMNYQDLYVKILGKR